MKLVSLLIGGLLLVAMPVSAQLNGQLNSQDREPYQEDPGDPCLGSDDPFCSDEGGGDGGGDGGTCFECIDDECSTAHEGHAGKSDCVAPHGCDETGCAYPCETSGTSCQGGSSGLELKWVVPNGETLTPHRQEPPTAITRFAAFCA